MILQVREVTFSAPNRIPRGEIFFDPQEIWTEDTNSTPIWGLTIHARALPSHEIYHIYESHGVWIRSPYGPVLQGPDNPPCITQGPLYFETRSRVKTINTMRGSCIEQGQKDGPTLTVNKTSTYLDNFFIHRWVIKQGIENTWGIWGCARLSSLNNPTTASIAAGRCVQRLGLYCVCNWNQ